MLYVNYIIILLLFINLGCFLVMGYDKLQAKRGGYRVREACILWWSFFGGALGVYLGMKVFRHKTQHTVFKYGVPLLLLCNLAAAAGIMYILEWGG